MPTTIEQFRKMLLEHLCQIIQELDGDCSQLFTPANPAPTESGQVQAAVVVVRERLQQVGYPTNAARAASLDENAIVLKALASDVDNPIDDYAKASAVALALAILNRATP